MSRILIVTGVALGLMAGGLFHGKGIPAPAGGPQIQAEGGARCPLIYAPVICDNGKTYPNQCVADQHHAKNCQPLGI